VGPSTVTEGPTTTSKKIYLTYKAVNNQKGEGSVFKGNIWNPILLQPKGPAPNREVNVCSSVQGQKQKEGGGKKKTTDKEKIKLKTRVPFQLENCKKTGRGRKQPGLSSCLDPLGGKGGEKKTKKIHAVAGR